MWLGGLPGFPYEYIVGTPFFFHMVSCTGIYSPGTSYASVVNPLTGQPSLCFLLTVFPFLSLLLPPPSLPPSPPCLPHFVVCFRLFLCRYFFFFLFKALPDVLPEICASGLRNPFRCSFDRATDVLYCGDVGHTNVEEIDIIEWVMHRIRLESVTAQLLLGFVFFPFVGSWMYVIDGVHVLLLLSIIAPHICSWMSWYQTATYRVPEEVRRLFIYSSTEEVRRLFVYYFYIISYHTKPDAPGKNISNYCCVSVEKTQ